MMNGDEDEVTANERPEPTYPDNKPVVAALVNATSALQQTCNLLSSLLHEVRTMDHPVEARTLAGLAAAGGQVEATGRKLREAMGG